MKKTSLVLSLLVLSFSQATPPRFLKVTEGVYRSGRPEKYDLKMLKDNYGIKTIIDLEDINFTIKNEKEWAKEFNLNFYSYPMSASKTPKDERVNAALANMSDPELQPVLVHCKRGRDRTGLIIGLFRVEKQHWTPGDDRSRLWNSIRQTRELF